MSLEETGVKLIADNASRFINQMDRSSDAVKRFGDRADRSSGRVNAMSVAFGNLISGGVTKVVGLFTDGARAASGFFMDGLNMAADLEAQMDAVGAVMGATNEEIDMLNGLVESLGLDPNLKVSSIEAAEAIEMLARNGLSMSDIMEGAARSTVALANATGADFSLAADVATDAMALFNVEAGDMSRVVDGVASVAANSKFTVDDYALALRNGGAAAADMQISLEDFNTVIAASAEEMGSGMRAGTGFRNFITRLTPATKPAREAMMELGLITADGSNKFLDATGRMKDMNEISIVLNGALANLSDAQRSAALETIFGADALGTALALGKEGEVLYTDIAAAAEELGVKQETLNQFIEGGITSFEALQAQMLETDGAEAAATRVDNLRGALDILSGVIEAIQIQFGNALIPALTDLSRFLTELVESNAEPLQQFFEMIGERIKLATDSLIESVNNGSTAWEAFMGVLEALGFEKLVENLELVRDTARGIFDFLTQNKETIVTAVAAIAGAFTAFKVISTIANSILALKAAWLGLTAAWAGGSTAITFIVGLLGGPLTIAIAAITAAVIGLFFAWQTNFMGIRDIVADVMPTIQGFINDAMLFVQRIVSNVLSAMAQFWADHGDSIMIIVNAFAGWVVGRLERFMNFVLAIVDGLVAAALFLWNMFGDEIMSLTQIAIDAIIAIWDSLMEALGFIIDAIAAAVQGDWEAFGENMRLATEAIIDALVAAFMASVQAFKQVTSQIVAGIITVWETTDWKALGKSVIDGLWQGIQNGAARVAEAARNVAQAAKDAVTGFFQVESPSRVMMDIADQVVDGFIIGLQRRENDITDAAAATFDFTDRLAAVNAGAMKAYTRSFIDPISKEIANLENQVRHRTGDLFELIEKDFGDIEDLDGLNTMIKKYEDITKDLRETITDEAGGLAEGFSPGRTLHLALAGRFGDKALDAAQKLVDFQKRLDDMRERADSRNIERQTKISALQGHLGEAAQERARQILHLEEMIALAKKEQLEREQKLADIEKQRERLGFLKNQIDLLQFVRETGIGGDLLAGLQLGSNADPESVLGVTASVFERVIAGLSSAISPAGAAGGNSGTVTNNNTTNSVVVNGTFQNEPAPVLASQLESVLANL